MMNKNEPTEMHCKACGETIFVLGDYKLQPFEDVCCGSEVCCAALELFRTEVQFHTSKVLWRYLLDHEQDDPPGSFRELMSGLILRELEYRMSEAAEVMARG